MTKPILILIALAIFAAVYGIAMLLMAIYGLFSPFQKAPFIECTLYTLLGLVIAVTIILITPV